MKLHLKRSPLIFAVLGLFVGLGQPILAQRGEKTPTERWLDAHRDPNGVPFAPLRGDEKRYFGEPIDLSLKDADLVEVLRSFAEIGRFNLIIQPGVRGKVTVELKQVPWDQALEQILKLNGLAMEITGGRVDVGPRTGGRGQTTGFDLLTVRLEPVHADPAVIARALNRPAAGVAPEARRRNILSAGGALRADGDSLVIRESRSGLRDFARVLSYIDVPSAADESAEALARRGVELWNRHVPNRPIEP